MVNKIDFDKEKQFRIDIQNFNDLKKLMNFKVINKQELLKTIGNNDI